MLLLLTPRLPRLGTFRSVVRSGTTIVSPLVVLALAGACCLPVAIGGQNALGDGTALDNNLSTTGGRINRPNQPFLLNRINNAIVTGNVGGGKQFRGDVGYSAEYDFRGSLGSDDTFRFRADSFASGLPLQGYGQAPLVQSPLGYGGVNRGGGYSPVEYGLLSRSGTGADLEGLARYRYGTAGGFAGNFGAGLTPDSSLGTMRDLRDAADQRDRLEAFPGLSPSRPTTPTGWSEYLDGGSTPVLPSRQPTGMGAAGTGDAGAADRWRPDAGASFGPGMSGEGLLPSGRDANRGGTATPADEAARAAGLTRSLNIEQTLDGVPFEEGFDARLRAAGLTADALGQRAGQGEREETGRQPQEAPRGTRTRPGRPTQTEREAGPSGDTASGSSASFQISRGEDRYLDLLAKQIAENTDLELPAPGEAYSPELIGVIREYHSAITGGRRPNLPGLGGAAGGSSPGASEQPGGAGSAADPGAEDEVLVLGSATRSDAGDPGAHGGSTLDEARDEGASEVDDPAAMTTGGPIAPPSRPTEGRRTDPLAERLNESSSRRYDSIIGAPPQVDALAGTTSSRFDEHMRMGEDALADGRYFDAERAFEQALMVSPDQPMAVIGLTHARMGAGLLRSAARSLLGLLQRHPELISARYTENVVPQSERLRAIGPSTLVPLLDRPDWPEAGLLLAYLGRLVGERDWVVLGLEDFADDFADEPALNDLIARLRASWLDGSTLEATP